MTSVSSVVPIGVLGDIHGDFESVHRIMRERADVPVWLCVGDLADGQSAYQPVPAPLHFVKGNNENFDLIASGRLPANIHLIPNGRRVEIGGVTVAGLGGTFAPTWYETPAAELPHPTKGSARATELADKRRHFVQEEVEACRALRGVDILLTHEAARPFRPAPGGRGPDAGKVQINAVLAALRPRLHFFGHHHRYTESEREGVRSIGLDLVSRSYVLVDSAAWNVTRVDR